LNWISIIFVLIQSLDDLLALLAERERNLTAFAHSLLKAWFELLTCLSRTVRQDHQLKWTISTFNRKALFNTQFLWFHILYFLPERIITLPKKFFVIIRIIFSEKSSIDQFWFDINFHCLNWLISEIECFWHPKLSRLFIWNFRK
jgi:hypothetical protein